VFCRGDLLMTIEEIRSRDFEENPLSPSEREDVLRSLDANLIALGCPVERLTEMRQDIEDLISESYPEPTFARSLDQALSERRERLLQRMSGQRAHRHSH
jgi:hypothetical protein